MSNISPNNKITRDNNKKKSSIITYNDIYLKQKENNYITFNDIINIDNIPKIPYVNYAADGNTNNIVGNNLINNQNSKPTNTFNDIDIDIDVDKINYNIIKIANNIFFINDNCIGIYKWPKMMVKIYNLMYYDSGKEHINILLPISFKKDSTTMKLFEYDDTIYIMTLNLKYTFSFDSYIITSFDKHFKWCIINDIVFGNINYYRKAIVSLYDTYCMNDSWENGNIDTLLDGKIELNINNKLYKTSFIDTKFPDIIDMINNVDDPHVKNLQKILNNVHNAYLCINNFKYCFNE